MDHFKCTVRFLQTIVFASLVAIGFSVPCAVSSDNALNNGYLTGYCNIQDAKWSARCLNLILRNYSGPSLHILGKPVELSEFVMYSDGKPKWIYHPRRQLLGPARADASIEVQFDAAIRASSPLPAPPHGWPMPTTMVVYYDPRKPEPLQLAGLDHPGEQDCIITRKSIAAAMANRWTADHAHRIVQRLGTKSRMSDHTWAAVWFRLNPDKSVDDIEVVQVLSGRKSGQKETQKREEQLKTAIQTTKTFEYHGAPVAKGEPVGLIAVYHPDMPSVLTVHTFLFDRTPCYVIMRRD